MGRFSSACFSAAVTEDQARTVPSTATTGNWTTSCFSYSFPLPPPKTKLHKCIDLIFSLIFNGKIVIRQKGHGSGAVASALSRSRRK
jgi:hypothetical protein